MRLWSIHPMYLDKAGLIALWRESLLAQKVLSSKTKGYQNHPQLKRFKNHTEPGKAIGHYLYFVYDEASKRGYHFSKEKILYSSGQIPSLIVTEGQLQYEFQHLKRKLRKRDPSKYFELFEIKKIEPHPLFKVIKGSIESWEKVEKKIKV
ncbi:MAG: hypothetical protein JW928_07405 [Candidatus Aureabacteria bacterium]|nr:hypothetical protein [Candidatus Auribacterota bacterium]